MVQRSTEERLATLEEQVALLLRSKQEQEAFKQKQETHNIALLARVDGISNDLHRVERAQIRGFEELRADQKELRAEVRAGHEFLTARLDYVTARLDTVEDDLTKVVEMGVKHREAIDMLLEGQQAHTEEIKSLKGAITSLQTGQQEVMASLQQIIEMLMGKPRRHD